MEKYIATLSDLQEIFWKQFTDSLFLLSGREVIMIGLSGGTSLLRFYQTLTEKFSEIPLSMRQKIRFCFLDERIVPLYHIDSNYRLCFNHIFDSLLRQKLLSESQIITIDIETEDIAFNYSEKVSDIDIAFFGVGPDGHIASLFPHHSLLSNISPNYLLIQDSPKEPKERITLSRIMIQHIYRSFVFFIGNTKKEALQNFEDIHLGIDHCPAKLTLSSGETKIFTDIFL